MDIEIKEGIKDSNTGTNQVNMALFMSQYLDVTYCVNYDIKAEIQKGPASQIIKGSYEEYNKLLKTDIKFMLTPPLEQIVETLCNEDALAQFVFWEGDSKMSHYGLLCKVQNDLLEFTQREHQTGSPDVTIGSFMSWWNRKDDYNRDPKQLVFIYRRKNSNINN